MTVEQDSPTHGVDTSTDAADTRSGDARTRPNGITVIRGWIRWALARWRPILVSGLLIAAMGLTAGVYFLQYRPSYRVDNAAERAVSKAASDGAVAFLSYSPDNLHRDFAEAKSHLTGDFLAYYDKFSEQMVTPVALDKQITTTASVIQSAVSQLNPNSAVVLLFVNQSTTSKEKPQPVMTPSSVVITLTKVHGSWLISKVDPM